MKKVITLLIAVAMLLALTACGTGDTINKNYNIKNLESVISYMKTVGENACTETENETVALLEKMGDTYKSYDKNTKRITDFYDALQERSSDLYDTLYSCSIDYFKGVAAQGLDDYRTWDNAMSDFYDAWDDIMDDYYDAWDDAMDDIYDKADDLIEDAYDDLGYSEYSDVWSAMYKEHSDTWSALYRLYSDAWSETYQTYSACWSGFYKKNTDVDAIVSEYKAKNAAEAESSEITETSEMTETTENTETTERTEPTKQESDPKPQKNGFDSSTNEVYTLASYTVEIPKYWKSEKKTDGGFQRYAETNGKVAMLQVSAQAETDASYPVTFDGLMDDNDNMMSSLEASTFEEITSYEVIDTGVVKGILYKGTLASDLPAYAECFVFASEEDSTWCLMFLAQTDNADYSYTNDFMKIIKSIKSSKNNSKIDNTSGIDPDFKAAMDAYEAFYDEYCDILQKYSKNPTDMTLLLEYSKLMAKAVEMDEAFAKWESEDLNSEELKYYLEVNNRVMQKMVDVMG